MERSLDSAFPLPAVREQVDRVHRDGMRFTWTNSSLFMRLVYADQYDTKPHSLSIYSPPRQATPIHSRLAQNGAFWADWWKFWHIECQLSTRGQERGSFSSDTQM